MTSNDPAYQIDLSPHYHEMKACFTYKPNHIQKVGDDVRSRIKLVQLQVLPAAYMTIGHLPGKLE